MGSTRLKSSRERLGPREIDYVHGTDLHPLFYFQPEELLSRSLLGGNVHIAVCVGVREPTGERVRLLKETTLSRHGVLQLNSNRMVQLIIIII